MIFTDRRGQAFEISKPWWHHQMETFSALLALCAGNSPVVGEFPSQRPVTRSFDVFFDMCLNKRLSKQTCGRRFETRSRSLWRHCNAITALTWWLLAMLLSSCDILVHILYNGFKSQVWKGDRKSIIILANSLLTLIWNSAHPRSFTSKSLTRSNCIGLDKSMLFFNRKITCSCDCITFLIMIVNHVSCITYDDGLIVDGQSNARHNTDLTLSRMVRSTY